jgi:ankyrin repeat protein
VLIRAGADVNARESWKGQTALMWAASANNAAAVTRLLAAGAERDATSSGGEYTALKFAVRAGAIAATRALLAAGADVEATLADDTSLLVLAVTNAHYELAAVLLEAGADPNAAAQGWTALHQIAWSRRWNMGFNLPGPSQTGDLDSLELVRRLVAHGADINARQTAEPRDGNRNKLDRIGATPFVLASKSCDLPLQRMLLEQGADPSIATGGGTTAVMAAAGVGIWAPGENPGTHEECLAAAQLAFEVGGGDVNAINDEGDTALHGAVYRGGAIPIIEFLIAQGARLDVINDLGWMPVTAADGVEYTPAVLKRYPEAAALLRREMAARGLTVPASSQPGAAAN